MEEQDAVALQQAYDGHMNQPHVRMFQSTTDKRIDMNRHESTVSTMTYNGTA